MEIDAHHLWIGLAGGLLGFAHCLGMCGGFALHLARGKNGRNAAACQLPWLAGKMCSYLFLGAVAGYAGGYLEAVLARTVPFRNLLGLGAGVAILLAGLSLLGLLPVRRPGAGGGALAALARNLLADPSPGAALALGLFTGMLPCPVVLAFLAFSLQSGSVPRGMATMGGVGLGTMVPLVLLGALSRLSGLHLRSWAPRAGGIVLVLLGLTTAFRGTEIYHRLLGCPPAPALQEAERGTAKATGTVKDCRTGGVHAPGRVK